MAATLGADVVLKELDELWVELASEPGSAPGAGVLRACAMTLMVLEEEGSGAGDSAGTVAQVMREHPNRAVVVRVRAGAEPVLEHRVTAQCWMPLEGRRQVCCEQIEITVSDGSLAGLTPILLAIAAPDLPLVVWCRSARLLAPGPLDGLFGRAGKVIVDGCPLDELAAHAARGLRVADLAWTGVTRWREIVAQVFEDPARLDFAREIRSVAVAYAGAGRPAAAGYLAAWVEVCAGCGEVQVRFDRAPETDGIAGVQGLQLGSVSHTISIRRAQGEAVLIEVDSLRSCAVIPVLSGAGLLGNELGISGRDAVFERVLPVAARWQAR
jgi:glucose-6-phosphate dehydrogenase assembly protein OpcA